MLSGQVKVWPTPRNNEAMVTNQAAMNRVKSTGYHSNIEEAVALKERGMWPTPTQQDGENDGGPSQFDRNSQPLNTIVKDPAETQGSLNPDWVEWLMGLPIGWTDIEAEPVEHPGWDDDPAERKHNIPTPSTMDHLKLKCTSTEELNFDTNKSVTLERYVDHHGGEDANIPRLTTRKQHRVNRLKACGNGVVPQQAALALRLLLGI